MRIHRKSDVKPCVEGIVLDELAAGFDDIAHEDREHAVGFDGVVLVELDFEHLALFGIHGGLEELLRVHFSEALEPLDREAALADLEDFGEDFGNGEERVADSLFAFALDEFKDRFVAVGVVFDFQAFAGELVDELLRRDGFVKLDKLGPAAGCWIRLFGFHRRLGRNRVAFSGLWRGVVVKAEIAIAFDLSPQNLGVERDVNRNTAEVGEDRDWVSAIKPMAHLITSHITRETIQALLGFSQLEFAFKGLDREDEQAEATVYSTYYASNVLTPNEQRAYMGLPPSESPFADMLFVEANQAMAQQAAQAAADAAERAAQQNQSQPNVPKG